MKTRSMPARAGALLAALAAGLPATGARAADGPYVTVSASATWQDNVANATAGDGVISAFMLGSSANVHWLTSLDFSTLLSGGFEASTDICTSYSGLDRLAFGPRLELFHKLGLGAYAPTLSLGLEADTTAYGDSARSNVDAAVVMRLTQRLNEAVQAVIEGRATTREARADVYGGNSVSLGATLNWDLSDTWRLKATGGWRDGDIVPAYQAYYTPSGYRPIDTGAYYYQGDNRTVVTTFDVPFIAYRARYATWSYGFGISPAIGPNTSLTFSFTRFRTQAYDLYVNDLVSAGVVHHF
jgi:hypothetical protein